REKPGAKWKPTKQPLKEGPPKIRPLATAPDQKRLLVADYRKDPAGEFAYFDLATATTEPIPGAGAAGSRPQIERWGSYGETGAVVGTLNAERRRTFLQADTEGVRNSVAAALSGAEVSWESFAADDSRLVALVSSDRSAGTYVLVDRKQ